jgi:hypothetical protein
VIRHSCYPVDPWRLHETTLDLDVLAESESILALSNGHIGLRGNLDEGDPHGTPGTYLNSFYELRTLPYAETGYGYPEAGEAILNVTNGKLMRLLVDDEPFDVRYGQLRTHERTLDFRAGTLERRVEWKSPTGKIVRVRSTRLVSFTHRAIAAICYEVEPVARPARIIVRSEMIGGSSSLSGMDGRVGVPAMPFAIRYTEPWPARASPAGRVYYGLSGNTLISSGTPAMSRSMATQRSNKQSDSDSFTCSKRERAQRSGRSGPRDSPGPAITAMRSGTRKCSFSPSSPIPHRRRPGTRCVGGTPRSALRGSERGR